MPSLRKKRWNDIAQGTPDWTEAKKKTNCKEWSLSHFLKVVALEVRDDIWRKLLQHESLAQEKHYWFFSVLSVRIIALCCRGAKFFSMGNIKCLCLKQPKASPKNVRMTPGTACDKPKPFRTLDLWTKRSLQNLFKRSAFRWRPSLAHIDFHIR